MQRTGEFVETERGFRWVETHEHELADTGCIYLMVRPGDEPHMIYKLHKFEDVFKWIGIWNSCCHWGYPKDHRDRNWTHEFESIESAIKIAQQYGNKVKRSIFSRAFQFFNFDNL